MTDRPDSELIDKGPCDHCGSSDARARYTDGHSYCFACPEDTAWQPGEGTDRGDPTGQPKSVLPRELIRGDHAPLNKRKLTLATCQRYDYRVGTEFGETVQLAPYHNASGQVVAQKVRPKDKDNMHWVGKKKGILPLFGQAKMQSSGRMVVVTEGEIDAMSVSQAMGNSWPVVSLPDGAGIKQATGAIAEASSWLEGFDKVVFMFDMDDLGRAAAAACAAIITPGKGHIAELPLKDASEMLQAGRERDIVSACWNARPYRPDGIRTVSDLRVEAMSAPTWGIPYPWAGLTRSTTGIRRGEIVMIGAGVGAGKTTVFKQLMAAAMVPELIQDHGDIPVERPAPRKVGALLLEEKPGRKTLKTIAGMVAGKRFHDPKVEFAPEELGAAIDRLDGLFFAYDHFGAKDWASIKPLIRYMVLALGIKDVFLDHLTALVAGAEDERRELDSIMADMASLVEELDFTLYVISHLTTPKGTAHEEGGRVHEKDFTGSRAIARWAHNMHGLERNKQEPNSPTTWRVLKDRELGDGTGATIGLEYDRETGRYFEVPLDEDQHGFRDETRKSDF